MSVATLRGGRKAAMQQYNPFINNFDAMGEANRLCESNICNI